MRPDLSRCLDIAECARVCLFIIGVEILHTLIYAAGRAMGGLRRSLRLKARAIAEKKVCVCMRVLSDVPMRS